MRNSKDNERPGRHAPGPPGTLSDAGNEAAAGRKLGEYIFAALTLVLGVFVLVGAWSIRLPGAGSTVGPRVFPYLVSGILIVSAVMVLVDIWRGRLGEQEEGEDVDVTARTDWPTLAKLVAFIVAHIVLIEFIGWPLAAALLFGGVAWSLGTKRWWVGVLIGLALGAAIQLVFGVWLGLSLPLGPLLSWLEPLLRQFGI